jgi:transcriptional regulator with XRE-family HTH domain
MLLNSWTGRKTTADERGERHMGTAEHPEHVRIDASDEAPDEAPEPDPAPHQPGSRLRGIRQAKGLSLTAVAESAGVTKGFLSLVERGRARASVPTLLAICSALGTTIGALFDYPDTPVVTLGIPVDMGGLGLQEYQLTGADEARIQVMRAVVEPGGGSGGEYTLETDTVFVFVLRGSLLLTIDGADRLLRPGQSTTYPGRVPRSYRNAGPEETELLWVLCPPLPRG